MSLILVALFCRASLSVECRLLGVKRTHCRHRVSVENDPVADMGWPLLLWCECRGLDRQYARCHPRPWEKAYEAAEVHHVARRRRDTLAVGRHCPAEESAHNRGAYSSFKTWERRNSRVSLAPFELGWRYDQLRWKA